MSKPVVNSLGRTGTPVKSPTGYYRGPKTPFRGTVAASRPTSGTGSGFALGASKKQYPVSTDQAKTRTGAS